MCSNQISEGETFYVAELPFRFTTEWDDSGDTPWERSDGHGPVSKPRRFYHGEENKAPGEVRLYDDRGYARYYDFAEATRIAKRDGWGLCDAELAKLETRLGRKPTRKQIVREAVQRDYDFLRGWCNDDWHYVGVVVTRMDTGEEESLWGIESDAEDYIRQTAEELAGQLVEAHERETARQNEYLEANFPGYESVFVEYEDA